MSNECLISLPGNTCTCTADKPIAFFLYLSAPLHSHMRMGLSPLNAHRHSYNFINNNVCLLCSTRIENTFHYFLKCPTLANQRVTLMNRVTNILLMSNT